MLESFFLFFQRSLVGKKYFLRDDAFFVLVEVELIERYLLVLVAIVLFVMSWR